MKIPQQVQDLFNRTVLVAFGTADKKCDPNVNVVFWKKIIDDETIILLDNFFNTTKQNIMENSKICLSFWDAKNEEGYKIKGNATYHSSGMIFDLGKEFIQQKNPGRTPNGVVEIKVGQVYILTPGKAAGRIFS
jgi:hypothetical protein